MIDNATSKKRGSWKSRMVSAFDVAAKPVKSLVRDSRTQEAFDQMEADTLLESSSAMLKHSIVVGGAKNAITNGFLKRYQEIVDPKKLGAAERKRAAAKLEREVNDYAAELAEHLQALDGLNKHLALVSSTLEDVGADRFNEVKSLFGEMIKAEEIIKRLAAKLARDGRLAPDDDRDMALAKSVLGSISAASLSNFTTPGEYTARAMAVEQRAIADPRSESGQLAVALGKQLRTRALGMYAREAESGQDFKKLGEKVPLTDEELIALYTYTDHDYEAMNLLLITGGKNLTAEQRNILQIKIDFCKRGLAKLPNYPNALYPVVRWENDSYDWRSFYQVGKVFRNMQFWSSGATAGAATGKGTPTRLVFRIYGQSGKDIAMLSSKQGEGALKDQTRPEAYLKNLGKGEVLFAPQTPFKVMSIAETPQPNGMTFVYITVMEQPH